MKSKTKLYFTGLIMLLFILGASVPVHAAVPSASVTAKVDYTESNKFLKKLNNLRNKKGLPSVKIDKSLQKAAELRAAELTVRYAHRRPNGKMPVSVTKKIAEENIAMNCGDAGEVYSAWKNSHGHYQNMVRRNMRSIGICCLEYQGCTYWVNLFGSGYAKAVKPAGRKTKTFKVSIASKYLSAAHIELSSRDTMGSGEKLTLRIVIRCSGNDSPGLLPNSFFKFKSSNPKVLKVTQKGIMSSKKEGRAKITIQSKKYKKLKKSFWIYVDDESNLDYTDYSDD